MASRFFLVVAMIVMCAQTSVADIGQHAATAAGQAWIFSAPPRGSKKAETARYAPIAHFLQTVSHHRVIYQYPGTWLNYSRKMVDGRFDLIFDGPHFTGWRDRHLGYTPLVRLPHSITFVVVERANERFRRIRQLAGRPICANSPPYLGTLMVLNHFPNPDVQPYIVVIHGWLVAYRDLMHNECAATVLPLANLRKLEHGGHLVRVLYKSPPYPNQAISASPRIPPAIQRRLRAALLSPAGRIVTRPLRRLYVAKPFIRASAKDYVGLGRFLKNTLYFGYK